jgi:hypothetical protein
LSYVTNFNDHCHCNLLNGHILYYFSMKKISQITLFHQFIISIYIFMLNFICFFLLKKFKCTKLITENNFLFMWITLNVINDIRNF